MPLRPITDVAQDLGFSPADIETYGNDKAKIPLQSFPTRSNPRQARRGYGDHSDPCR